jgi:hypothetical protein
MRLGLEPLLSLDLHGVIHDRREGRCHGSWAVLDEQGREVVDRRAFVLVGHLGFLGGVAVTPRKPRWLTSSNSVAFRVAQAIRTMIAKVRA